jgi:hypothetical protein
MTIGAPADQLKMVRQQLEPFGLRDTVNLPLDLRRRDQHHARAVKADQMVVVSGLADGVPMAAVTGVDAIEHAELDEQLQRAEHRRPPDAFSGGPQILPDLLSAEVVAPWSDEVHDHLSRTGEAASTEHERFDDLGTAVGVRHISRCGIGRRIGLVHALALLLGRAVTFAPRLMCQAGRRCDCDERR